MSSSDVDHLFIQNLINRLQSRNPNPPKLPVPPSLDALLFDAISNLHREDDAKDKNDGSRKSKLAREESTLEKELIRLIRSGDTQKLKPNSGQAVKIGEHHICLGNRVDGGSDYRVWEWHGHVMMFDEETGYVPEYIYGNHFERIMPAAKSSKEETTKEEDVLEEVEVEEVEKPVNLGLKGLIGGVDSGEGRIVRRGLNPARYGNDAATLLQEWQLHHA